MMLVDQGIVAGGDGLAVGDPAFQVRQLDAQHGRLQRIQAGVPTEIFVVDTSAPCRGRAGRPCASPIPDRW